MWGQLHLVGSHIHTKHIDVTDIDRYLDTQTGSEDRHVHKGQSDRGRVGGEPGWERVQ